MEPNPVRTLAAAIAAGEDLLATRCAGARATVGGPGAERGSTSTLVTPQPARGAPPLADGGLVADDDWRTADDIALQAGWDPWTVDGYLRDGVLHGHDDTGSGEWLVRGRVAEAFVRGRDLAAQRRACGCRALRLVHPSGRAPRSSDGWASLH